MDSMTVELEIYSPRWGHEDVYEITLTENLMTIEQGGNIVKCEWQENSKPKWSGDKSLKAVLENDHIYPPSNFQHLLERTWKS